MGNVPRIELLTAQVSAQAPATPQKLNSILCETEDQAMAFASAMTSGKTEPIAINLVNKAAGAEVCGRYIGYAVVETAGFSSWRACALPKTAGSVGPRTGWHPSAGRTWRAGSSENCRYLEQLRAAVAKSLPII